jgi:amino acid adenylation domain-containing protein
MLEEALRYWREQLAGAPPLLTLPTDRPRPLVRRYRGASETLPLPPALATALRTLTRAEGATLFMTLLSAYAVLLGRYSGQADVVVGSSVSVITLPLRISLAGAPSFRALLPRVREVVLGAYAHQELPFERLVGELWPQGSLQHHPVFQVLFQLESSRQEEPRPSDAAAVPSTSSPERAPFDLSLLVDELEDQTLRCHCTYDADLFDVGTIRHLLQEYRTLLDQIAAAPDQAIDTHSLVTREAGSVLPDPTVPLPRKPHPLVFEAVAARAIGAPKAVAVVHGDRRWTYEQLMTAVGNIAQALEAAGVDRGHLVVVTGSPSFGLIASMLGTLVRGAVMVPLDPLLPEGRRQVMFEQAAPQAAILVDQAGLAGRSPPATLKVDPGSGNVVASEFASQAGKSEQGLPGPDDAAYVFFTSGTTGVPKGVLGVHHALAHFLAWEAEALNLSPEDRVALFSSPSFDVMLRDTFLPLATGATLVLPPANLAPDGSLAWLAGAGITILHVTPSRARLWADTAEQGTTAHSLRWVCFSGEALSDVIVRRWRSLTSPRCRFVNLYGPTEATMVKCFHLLPDDEELRPGVQPVGRPLPDTQILVLGERDRLCGVGEVGELVVRTPHLALGYLNLPRDQSERFGPNPFRGDAVDRIYRTGDLGRYRADGTLLWLGRRDHQLKINGFRLEPDEVTATLARHPAVRACAVIGYQGEAGAVLAAFVVRDGDVEPRDLRAYLGDRVLAVMVPGSFTFVPRLPLTSTGKIDRQALLALPRACDEAEAEAAPVGPLEEELATMWREVLGVERLGRREDVFTRGAHSLVILQVIARILARFGVALAPRAIFEASTVADLADTVAWAVADQIAGRLEAADEPA